jgi:putative transposase
MQIVEELIIPDKKAAIKASLKATREKRKNQQARVYEIKIDKSHLNNKQLAHLNRLFLEAKWFYNYILSQDDIFEVSDKTKEVQVKIKDEFELRELEYLSSQMKQSILSRTIDNIKGLHELKSHYNKIGKLKFKSEVNSISLKQFGNTYDIIDNKHIRVQGIKKKIKVEGLKQIPDNADIANSMLVKKHGDFYLKITTYQEKEHIPEMAYSTGIDFGISRQLTLNNGIGIEYSIPVNGKLKRLYKQFSRKEKHSKNWYKVLTKIEKEFDNLNNIKKDIKNKIIKFLKDNFGIVCYQDESVKAWQRIYGRKILSTAIGGIISTLQSKVRTPVGIDKFFPSTKTCSKCGNIQNIELSERVYVCSSCRNIMDRDWNAANNILNEGLKKLNGNREIEVEVEVATGRSDFKPGEIEPLLKHVKYLNNIPYVKASLVYESGSLKEYSLRSFTALA